MGILGAFWDTHADLVLAQILSTVGAAVLLALLLRVWRVAWSVVTWIGNAVYWMLIGWWVARIRRWITGSTW